MKKPRWPCNGASDDFVFSNFASVYLWNNGLREAVVTDCFLFLSTFFIQVLDIIYILSLRASISFCLNK